MIDKELDEECKPAGLKQCKLTCALKAGYFEINEELNTEASEEQIKLEKQMADLHAISKHQQPLKYVPTAYAGCGPNSNIELEYVYGYRCYDTRNNLRYSADGNQLIYHAATIGIVYDKKLNTQTFFRGHSDDIHCLAIHPDPTLKFVATGQLG